MLGPGRILIVSGVVIACGYAYDRYQRRAASQRDSDLLNTSEARKLLERLTDGVWSEPRPLIEDIQVELVGPGQTHAGTGSGRVMEVSLTPRAQFALWRFVTLAADEGLTENIDEATAMALVMAIDMKYDVALRTPALVTEPHIAAIVDSTRKLIELAELSRKYGVKPGAAASKGALICPGWVHERSAPTHDVRPGDHVELLVDRYSPEPGDDGQFMEWAWGLVTSANPAADSIVVTVESGAPAGEAVHVLRFGEHHGYRPGASVTVPRRCVFRVIKRM
jgi:hypothetical protein